MKQENKEKIAQAEEILERLKEQRGGNVLSIHKKWQMIQNCSSIQPAVRDLQTGYNTCSG